MLFPLFAAALAVFGAPSLSGQSQALPKDAKALLQIHQQFAAMSDLDRASEEQTLQRAYVYLQAGAEHELREEINNLTEDHPDALRFAMQADCWNPAHFLAGRDRAETWLKSYPSRSKPESDFVKSVQVFLGDAETRRELVYQRVQATSWYPFAATLGALALALLISRKLS